MIEFEWDSHNLKHILEDYPERGNTPQEIESVFQDPYVVIRAGRTLEGEQRLNAVGKGISGIVKVVIYTKDNAIIRPITCWPANKQTIRFYYESIKGRGDNPEQPAH